MERTEREQNPERGGKKEDDRRRRQEKKTGIGKWKQKRRKGRGH